MPAVDDSRLLGELELFQGLTPGQLADLNGLLRSSAVPAGTHFITADQPGEVVYVLIEGTVKIYVTQADGREVILAFLGPGDTVGEMSLVDSSGRSANVTRVHLGGHGSPHTGPRPAEADVALPVGAL